jgi:UDP-glucose 4-epimerase
MKKALVTGGSGFLGSYLCEDLLKRGSEVYALDIAGPEKVAHLAEHKNFHYVQGSVLDRDMLDSLINRCDIVFHFGAMVGVHLYVMDPLNVLEVNIQGTRLIAELAFKYGKKVCFASTSEVYGKSTKIPYNEDDDRVLGSTKIDRWCYSTSKAAGEHYLFAYHKLGLPIVIYRFFNAYGPRLDKLGAGRVITIFLEQFLNNKPITVADDGNQTRCFTYVDDAIEAVIKAAELKKAEGEIFNIGSNKEVTMLELANLMKKIGSFSSEIELTPYKKVYGKSYEDVRRRVPDIKKAKEILGWEAKTSLEAGLKKTIDYFRKSLDKK